MDEWREQARCKDEPTDLFFPVDGNDLAARLLCAECTVQAECGAEGEQEPYGVWGGVLHDAGVIGRGKVCATCGGRVGLSGLIRGRRQWCSLDCYRQHPTERTA